MNLEHVSLIVTHDGQFHADEVFALAALRKLRCRAQTRRTRNPSLISRFLADPSVIVLDVGGVFDPDRLNFDHHQHKSFPATNILILERFHPWWGPWVKESLFNYISDVDRGVIGDGGATYAINRIIRNFNLMPGDTGFQVAVETATAILDGYIESARKVEQLRRVWTSLERTPSRKVVVIPNYEQTEGWKICAAREEILLASPWRGKGWQLEVKNSTMKIPHHPSQTFLHSTGFCATYPDKATALQHAEEITKAV